MLREAAALCVARRVPKCSQLWTSLERKEVLRVAVRLPHN